MRSCPVPENEELRLQALAQYKILDTPAEEDFDGITELLSFTCNASTALVSLIDSDRQWFKSSVGIDVRETPRDIAFCAYAIMGTELFIIEDARNDKRFKNNPLVTGEPHIRFYAGAPLVTPEGFTLGTLCAIDTQPKRLSQTQKRHLRVLANLVEAQLESRLKVEKLEQSKEHIAQAQQQLEHANQHRSIFLAKMSHEMRTPLNSIVGFSSRLNRRLVGVDTPSYLNEGLSAIEAAAKHLGLLIDNLLDLTQFEPLQGLGDIEVEALLNELVEANRAQAKLRDIKLCTDFSKTCTPKLFGAAEKLRQVLQNLLNNAVRFSNVGDTVTIELSCAGESVRIAVIDQGVGMAEQQLTQLFTPFTQLDNQLDKSYSGAGIGLSISKSLVEAMGGQLHVSSTPGNGARFTVELPQARHT